jgi:hypothetical protein
MILSSLLTTIAFLALTVSCGTGMALVVTADRTREKVLGLIVAVASVTAVILLYIQLKN